MPSNQEVKILVLLYSRLFHPAKTFAKTDEKPEPINQSELPLDEIVQAQNHQNKTAETTNKVKRTYHLERRTFL
jgi:hypothetical protein